MPVVIRTFDDFKADCAAHGHADGFRPPGGSDKTYYVFGWWSDGMNNFAEFDDRDSDAAIAHLVKYCQLRLDAYAAEYGEVRKILHDQAALAARSPACAAPPHVDCVRELEFLRDRVIAARREWVAAKERFAQTDGGRQEAHRQWLRQREQERAQQSADLLRQIELV